jgi:regulatory protein YycI of two-component signal transduction system YycFG
MNEESIGSGYKMTEQQRRITEMLYNQEIEIIPTLSNQIVVIVNFGWEDREVTETFDTLDELEEWLIGD